MSLNARLARYSLTTTKNKSSSDPAQVPTSAVLDVYRQGAVINAAATVPGDEFDFTLTVADIGRVEAGDQLCKNLDFSHTIGVETVVDHNTLIVSNNTSTDFVLAAGDRLVILSVRPRLFTNCPADQRSRRLGRQCQKVLRR